MKDVFIIRFGEMNKVKMVNKRKDIGYRYLGYSFFLKKISFFVFLFV